jgi:hypothetical protein
MGLAGALIVNSATRAGPTTTTTAYDAQATLVLGAVDYQAAA